MRQRAKEKQKSKRKESQQIRLDEGEEEEDEEKREEEEFGATKMEEEEEGKGKINRPFKCRIDECDHVFPVGASSEAVDDNVEGRVGVDVIRNHLLMEHGAKIGDAEIRSLIRSDDGQKFGVFFCKFGGNRACDFASLGSDLLEKHLEEIHAVRKRGRPKKGSGDHGSVNGSGGGDKAAAAAAATPAAAATATPAAAAAIDVGEKTAHKQVNG